MAVPSVFGPDTGAIIGLAGLAGAGKTSVAEALAERYHFVRLSFAAPIKDMARAFGLTATEIGPAKEEPCAALCGRTPRQFMQWLGTEFGRDLIGADVWVNAWARRVFAQVEEVLVDGVPLRIVCDDVRFADEAARLRGLGGRIIRLTRHGAGTASGAGHPSERQEFAADATVANDGSLDDAVAAVLAAAT